NARPLHRSSFAKSHASPKQASFYLIFIIKISRPLRCFSSPRKVVKTLREPKSLFGCKRPYDGSLSLPTFCEPHKLFLPLAVRRRAHAFGFSVIFLLTARPYPQRILCWVIVAASCISLAATFLQKSPVRSL